MKNYYYAVNLVILMNVVCISVAKYITQNKLNEVTKFDLYYYDGNQLRDENWIFDKRTGNPIVNLRYGFRDANNFHMVDSSINKDKSYTHIRANSIDNNFDKFLRNSDIVPSNQQKYESTTPPAPQSTPTTLTAITKTIPPSNVSTFKRKFNDPIYFTNEISAQHESITTIQPIIGLDAEEQNDDEGFLDIRIQSNALKSLVG